MLSNKQQNVKPAYDWKQITVNCKRDSHLIGYGDHGVYGPIIVNKSCARMRTDRDVMEVCQEKHLLLAKNVFAKV